MSRPYITIAPHYPAGLLSPAQLRELADVAEQWGAQLKISGSSILLTGIPAAEQQKVLAALKQPVQSFAAAAVRSVAACAGKPACPRALQDSTSLALLLDQAFYGLPTPGKTTIAVSGCPNCCAEVFVKDIGLFGLPSGYQLVVGGNAGRRAKAGKIIGGNIPASEVIPVIAQLLAYYRRHAQAKERIGTFLERVGMAAFSEEVIPGVYRLPDSNAESP